MNQIDAVLERALVRKCGGRFFTDDHGNVACVLHKPRRESGAWTLGGWRELDTGEARGRRCDVCGVAFMSEGAGT